MKIWWGRKWNFLIHRISVPKRDSFSGFLSFISFIFSFWALLMCELGICSNLNNKNKKRSVPFQQKSTWALSILLFGPFTFYHGLLHIMVYTRIGSHGWTIHILLPVKGNTNIVIFIIILTKKIFIIIILKFYIKTRFYLCRLTFHLYIMFHTVQ